MPRAQAIIMAGGRGTRLAPYTATIPKPLVPIDQYPILEIILRQLKYYGITDVTLMLGHMAGFIQNFFGDGKKLGLNIRSITEKKALGTAGALSLIPRSNSPLLVMNGDLFTTMNFKKIVDYHLKHRADATIGLHDQEQKVQLGVVHTDSQHNITSYAEKPVHHYNVSIGIYALAPGSLQLVPKNTFYDFPDLVRDLIAKKKKVLGYQDSSYWLDIGRPDDYVKAIEKFKQNKKLFLKS